ncbi:hypothetical protein JI435_400960 [Parastagonospora nodorum SN15]|uniref:Uncharacterized protein n=1 Tax=Phaeosphaeria nodorum (strain SN15 / ATCC MYA-4574 / FGSC 10173) TaxID=321614 RepID=A0A7U2HWB9_PHANO|nr:hypothetical protein JI435_400960 [Parastagonospora nodorum SN15]
MRLWLRMQQATTRECLTHGKSFSILSHQTVTASVALKTFRKRNVLPRVSQAAGISNRRTRGAD